LEKDVRATAAFFLESSAQNTKQLGEQLQEAIEKGKLILTHHAFWNSPLAMWEMPQQLVEELTPANLIIVKGDANYRRLLGDRHWDFTTPFEQVVNYMPVPMVALRTLKAEIVIGLDKQQVIETAEQDKKWLYNGRWGLIQFSKGISS